MSINEYFNTVGGQRFMAKMQTFMRDVPQTLDRIAESLDRLSDKLEKLPPSAQLVESVTQPPFKGSKGGRSARIEELRESQEEYLDEPKNDDEVRGVDTKVDTKVDETDEIVPFSSQGKNVAREDAGEF